MSAANDCLVRLDPAQREAIAALLDAERKHVSSWWACLNELRLHKELPEWASSGPFGKHADYDAWAEDRKALNRALFGRDLIQGQQPAPIDFDGE